MTDVTSAALDQWFGRLHAEIVKVRDQAAANHAEVREQMTALRTELRAELQERFQAFDEQVRTLTLRMQLFEKRVESALIDMRSELARVTGEVALVKREFALMRDELALLKDQLGGLQDRLAISIDLEAYERLERARRSPTESFSRVIKRAQWPSESRTAAGLLETLEKVGTPEPTVLERLDQAQRADIPPGDSWHSG